MKQAWGWLMAGVVAAGLNASYHDGGFRLAHELTARVGHNVEAVLALASSRPEQFVSEARMLTAQEQTSSCRFATAMARVQTRVETRVARSDAAWARFEVMSDREQAQMDANRARIEAKIARIRIPAAVFQPMVYVNTSLPAACPRVRVSVPKIPEVRVVTMSTDPI